MKPTKARQVKTSRNVGDGTGSHPHGTGDGSLSWLNGDEDDKLDPNQPTVPVTGLVPDENGDIEQNKRTDDSVLKEGDQLEKGKSTPDVPKIRIAGEADFDNPVHLGLFAPDDPDGPTVLINADSPILESQIKMYQGNYPSTFADQVREIVLNTYGEIAAFKVAHIQFLTKHAIREQELDESYRNEKSMTAALMGLYDQDAVIERALDKKLASRASRPASDDASSTKS